MDEPQAGVSCASGVEEVDQGVVLPGVVGAPLFPTAVVEVCIGALVEALPYRCSPLVVIVGEGCCSPWCPCNGVACGTLRRHLSRCRGLAVRSVTTLPPGDCGWTWPALGHPMG